MGARIIIVEDEHIIAVDLEARLKRWGHQVMGIAHSGEQGIALAIRYQPDLIFMDVRLQGHMNGIQAAAMIRSIGKIPVIFVTAFADSVAGMAQDAEALNLYLRKPFTSDELKDTLSSALKMLRTDAG